MICTSETSAPVVELIGRAEAGERLSIDEIARLLSITDENECELLFEAADRVRRLCVGDEVHLRGIVEFSNHCINNCLYCGLRRDNRFVRRYRMTEDEIVEASMAVKASGCPTVVLQSGDDAYYTRERMCSIIRRIVDETGLVVTLSVGQRSYEDYKAFHASGAARYLLRHETSNPDLFARLCPGRTLDQRLACISWLKEMGFETGMGCMVGLPGQTVSDLARDVLLTKELDADMIGIGPFIPHENTPLRGHTPGDATMVLKMVAITRLVTRNTNIPATTALGVLDRGSRLKALDAGANVFMPDFTPCGYASKYEIYPGKGAVADAGENLAVLASFLAEKGRTIGTDQGWRPRT